MPTATYVAGSLGASLLPLNKSVFALMNNVGSNSVVKIYRMWILNNTTGSATNTPAVLMELKSITGFIKGTLTTGSYVKMDSADPDIPSQISTSFNATCSLVGTPGDNNTWKRIWWSTDEAKIGTLSSNEFEVIVPLNCIWNSGYGDNNIQPLTLREGEGVSLQCTTLAGVHSPVDVFVEFTVSGTA